MPMWCMQFLSAEMLDFCWHCCGNACLCETRECIYCNCSYYMIMNGCVCVCLSMFIKIIIIIMAEVLCLSHVLSYVFV